MENMYESLPPRLEKRPFFEDNEHCGLWIDKILLEIEVVKQSEQSELDAEDLDAVYKILSDTKALLMPDVENIPQQEIDDMFMEYVSRIGDSDEGRTQWGEIGKVYLEVWNYARRNLAAENQE